MELEVMDDALETRVYVCCKSCFCQGPAAWSDEEEDGPIDPKEEAVLLWNDEPRPVTFEQVADLAPQLEASLAELERIDPEVRALGKKLDNAEGALRKYTESIKDLLTAKERAILERRFRREER
jgi:hypothetical protein